MKLRRIVKIFLFIIVLGASLMITYSVYSWKDTSGNYISSVKQLDSTPKNTIDAVFVGSSHVYCGILPEVMWEEYGIAAFDMAVSGADRNASYYQLEHLLKKQSPKVVFVDIYGLVTDKIEIEGNMHRNYMALNTSKESVKLVLEDAEKESVRDYLVRWPIIHTRYRELEQYDYVNNPQNDFRRGEHLEWHTATVYREEGVEDITECAELGEEVFLWLDKMQQLAKRENFKLVYMVVPMRLFPDTKMKINAVEAYCQEKGITFLDFEKYASDLGISFQTDYADNEHLNAKGAEKLSSFVGKYISANYSLDDHRGDKKYSQWDEDLEWFKNEKLFYNMGQTVDSTEYLGHMSNLSNMEYIVVLNAECDEDISKYEDFLLMSGIEYEQMYEGGAFHFAGGKVNLIPSEGRVIDIDKESFYTYYNEDEFCWVVNGIQETYVTSDEYFSVLVIDSLNGKVRENSGFINIETE